MGKFLNSHFFPIPWNSSGSCRRNECFPSGSIISFFFLFPFDWALCCDGQLENTGTRLLNTPLLSAHYLDLQVISGAATSAMTSLTNVATSAPLHGLYHSSCVIKQPTDTSRGMLVVSYLPQGEGPSLGDREHV